MPGGIVDRLVVLHERCLACDGEGEGCPVCEGAGKLPMTRCPRARLTSEAAGICEDAMFVEMGVLPAPGGVPAQVAGWWRRVNLVLEEKGRIARERAKK